MADKWVSDGEIAKALRDIEEGTPVEALCRRLQVSQETIKRWKKQYDALAVSELRELRQLEDERRVLKGLLADLTD